LTASCHVAKGVGNVVLFIVNKAQMAISKAMPANGAKVDRAIAAQSTGGLLGAGVFAGVATAVEVMEFGVGLADALLARMASLASDGLWKTALTMGCSCSVSEE